tara:strand:+ start:19515 stop:20720 length:1206 start_codon:yes stop_codon:yes gene_type:complete
MPKIQPSEFAARLGSLQRIIAREGLDIFIVSCKDSIYYLTGAGYEPLERPFFMIVKPNGAPVLIAPMLDKAHMGKGANITAENTVSYWEYPAPSGRGWPEILRQQVERYTAIGVEPGLTMEVHEEIRTLKPKTAPLIEEMRLIKSSAEIAMIRRASYYADRAMSRMLNAAYYGSLAVEGFAETSKVTREMIRDVPDYDPVNSSVLMAPWAAPRSAQPHSIPAFSDPLKEGPHVALVLTRVNGYSAEVERTFFTAAPDSWSVAAFKAMQEARRRMFGMIRPGQSCHDIDASVNRFLAEEGFSGDEVRLHRTGHGFGLGAHEAPWIAEGSAHVLAKNMVISNEPGIYRSGVGGVRHSDTVLVTDDGYECLTRSPDSLDALTFASKPGFAKKFRSRLVRKALNI